MLHYKDYHYIRVKGYPSTVFWLLQEFSLPFDSGIHVVAWETLLTVVWMILES